jgi:intracellular septation protein
MAALFIDFLPVVVFFAAFWIWDLMVATAVLIAVTVVLAAYNWLRKREVNRMQLLTAALVLVFGGATLLLNDEMFIKWKPTIVYWLFAAVFAGSVLFGQPLLKRMLASKITLPDFAWSRLNTAWIAFFAAAGALNLWVVYAFSTETWVTFKLVAAVALPLLFALAQGFYIAKHAIEEETAG